MFTNTESTTYKTKTNDVYEDFHKTKAKFDFSGYKIQCFITKQTKINWWNERRNWGVAIVEFLEFKFKMYPLIKEDYKENKEAKITF